LTEIFFSGLALNFAIFVTQIVYRLNRLRPFLDTLVTKGQESHTDDRVQLGITNLFTKVLKVLTPFSFTISKVTDSNNQHAIKLLSTESAKSLVTSSHIDRRNKAILSYTTSQTRQYHQLLSKLVNYLKQV
jgi:uncharacterized surface anchored protein